MPPLAETRTFPALHSFRRVFEQNEFGRYILNSVVVAGRVVIASALIAFLAATAATRFRFRFRTTLLIMFLVARTFVLVQRRLVSGLGGAVKD